MRLVEDWKDAWKWLSIRFLAISLALQGALVAMPDEVRQYLPDWATHSLAIACLVAAALGRLIDQPSKDNDHGNAI